MDGVKVTIRGKDALVAKLRALVPGVEKAMGVANSQSAEEMASLARSFAPVATGALRASIRTEPGKRPGSYRVLAGGSATTKDGFDYALAAEFGTSAHDNEGIYKGSENPGVRRQSFFWPSYRLMKKSIKSRASRAINKAIKAARG